MTPANSHRFEAFDGQVAFYVAAYLSPKIIIKAEKIQRALPDEGFDEISRVYRADFVGFLAYTQAIEFHLNDDAHPALVDLQRFWDCAQTVDNYPMLFDLFLETLDTVTVRPVWNEALNSPAANEYAAAPELATALPSEPSEMDNLPADSPLSANGNGSTASFLPPSKRKGKQNVQPTQ